MRGHSEVEFDRTKRPVAWGVNEEEEDGWLCDGFHLVAWKMEVPPQRQGAQLERPQSSPKSRLCKASILRATGFDWF